MSTEAARRTSVAAATSPGDDAVARVSVYPRSAEAPPRWAGVLFALWVVIVYAAYALSYAR